MDIIQIRATILFVGAFINLIFFIILLFHGKNKATFHLSFLALFAALYAFVFGGSYIFEPKLLWNRACWVGVLELAAYLSFLYYFTGRTRYVKVKIFLWYLPAISIAALSLLTPYFVVNTAQGYPWKSVAGPFDLFGRTYIIIGIIWGIFYLVREHHKSTGTKKIQLKHLILGFGFYSVGGILAAGIIPLFYPKFSYIDISALMSVVWVGVTFYSIFKQQLFEIKIILTELLVLIIALVLFVQFFLVETSEAKIIELIIFITFLFISYLLIRMTQREVEGKEKAENLAGELKKMSTTLEDKIKERTEELEEIKSSLEIRIQARTRELKELTEKLEGQVQGRTKELQDKIIELEKFNRLAVGRELKMIELKEEIVKLNERLGHKKKTSK